MPPKPKLSPLRKITVKEAQQNASFWNVFKHAYQVAAARILQRRYRKKHKKLGPPHALLDLPTVRFLQEVESKDAEKERADIVKRIKAGHEDTLPFDQTHFLRQLTTAFRSGAILEDEFVDALMLEHLSEETIDQVYWRARPSVYRYPISSADTYLTSSIAYAEEKHIAEFHRRVQQLPIAEQQYFTVNLTDRQTIALLCDYLEKGQCDNRHLNQALIHYVERWNFHTNDEAKKINLDRFFNKDKIKKPEDLLKFILETTSAENILFCKGAFFSALHLMRRPEWILNHLDEFELDEKERKSVKSEIESYSNRDVFDDYESLHFHVEELETYRKTKNLHTQWGDFLISRHKQLSKLNCLFVWYLIFNPFSQMELSPADRNSIYQEVKKYVAGLYLNLDIQTILFKLLEEFRQDNKGNHAALKLAEFIRSQFSTLGELFFLEAIAIVRDRNHVKFLSNILSIEFESPFITESPDFYIYSFYSPLLCHVFPSVAAFNLLQECVYGKDAVQPVFIAGDFSTRVLSDLDDQHKRGVQIFNSDISSTAGVHGMLQSYRSDKMGHDLRFHRPRSSSEMRQELMSYLKNLIKKIKKCSMSSAIWAYSDKDFSGGCVVRKAAPEERAYLLKHHSRTILNCAGRKLNNKYEIRDRYGFWDFLEKHDEHLIILLDMILNPLQWKYFLGAHPCDYFNSKEEGEPYRSWFSRFKQIYETLEKLCAFYKNQSIEFYIIAFRLMTFSEKEDLLRQLFTVDLQQVFYWAPNAGLQFYPDFFDKKGAIEENTVQELSQRLIAIVETYKKVARHLEKLTTRQSQLFLILAYRLKDVEGFDGVVKVLSTIDLSKRLKIHSRDRKMYFLNNKGICTNERLPENPLALTARLTQMAEEKLDLKPSRNDSQQAAARPGVVY